MTEYVKDGGIWKPAQHFVRDASVFKKPKQGYVKDAGVWKPFLSPALVATYRGRNDTSFSYVVPLGPEPTADQRRYVVALCVYWKNGSGPQVAGWTLDDVPIAHLGYAPDGQIATSMAYAESPTGATATVRFSVVGNSYGAGIIAYTIMSGPLGIDTPLFYTDVDDPGSANANFYHGGVGIGAVGGRNSGTVTWTNLTEDIEYDWLENDYFSAASAHFADDASLTVTGDCSGTGGDVTFVLGSFKPL